MDINNKEYFIFNDFSLANIDVYGGTLTGGAIGYIDGKKEQKICGSLIIIF